MPEYNIECDEDIQQPVDVTLFECDICKNPVGPVWYQARTQSLPIVDYCQTCWPNRFSVLEPIDRLLHSEKDKPRIWPCAGCGVKLGGGCAWFSDTVIDLCQPCYAARKEFTTRIDSTRTDLGFITRGSPLIVNLAPTSAHVAPPGVSLSAERHREFIDLLPSLVLAHDLNGDYSFVDSSLLEWTLLTDLVSLPSFPADTAMAVRCASPFQVASVVCDDHGRVGLDVVFPTWDEYQTALAAWTPPSADEAIERRKKVDESFDDTNGCNEDLMASASTEYSVYLRLTMRLPVYYG